MPETFGKIKRGGSSTTASANYIRVCKYQSGDAGSLQSISFWVYNTGASEGALRCAIYDSNFNLLSNGTTEEKSIPVGTNGWITCNFSTPPEVAASTDYWLAAWVNIAFTYYYDAGSTDQLQWQLETFNGWPSSLSPTGFADRELSIYATYTGPETLGNTTVGLSIDRSADIQRACKYQSGSAGVLQSISLYMNATSAKVKCAIFDSSLNLLRTTEEKDGVAQEGWTTFNLSTPLEVAASTDYWLAFWNDGSITCYRSGGEIDQYLYKTKTYNSWDDPIVSPTYDDYDYSIYATYEEEEAAKTLAQACLI